MVKEEMHRETERHRQELRREESERTQTENEIRVSFETDSSMRLQRIKMMHEEELIELRKQLQVILIANNILAFYIDHKLMIFLSTM